MMLRSPLRLLSCLLVVAGVIGCDDDGPSGSDDPGLVVDPVFFGVLEEDTVRLAATLNGQPHAVTWEVQYDSIATVTAEGLVTGKLPGFTAVTATSTTNPNLKRSSSITVIAVPTLTLGTARTGLGGSAGTRRYFKVVVPAGKTELKIAMSGGTGDADMYVRFNGLPDTDNWDCRPFAGGNTETCTFANPAAGTWFVMLEAFATYSSVQLLATVTPP